MEIGLGQEYSMAALASAITKILAQNTLASFSNQKEYSQSKRGGIDRNPKRSQLEAEKVHEVVFNLSCLAWSSIGTQDTAGTMLVALHPVHSLGQDWAVMSFIT